MKLSAKELSRRLALLRKTVTAVESQRDTLEDLEDMKAVRRLSADSLEFIEERRASGDLARDPEQEAKEDVVRIGEWYTAMRNFVKQRKAAVKAMATAESSQSWPGVEEILVAVEELRAFLGSLENDIQEFRAGLRAEDWIEGERVDPMLVELASFFAEGAKIKEAELNRFRSMVQPQSSPALQKLKEDLQCAIAAGETAIEEHPLAVAKCRQAQDLLKRGDHQEAASVVEHLKTSYSDVDTESITLESEELTAQLSQTREEINGSKMLKLRRLIASTEEEASRFPMTEYGGELAAILAVARARLKRKYYGLAAKVAIVLALGVSALWYSSYLSTSIVFEMELPEGTYEEPSVLVNGVDTKSGHYVPPGQVEITIADERFDPLKITTEIRRGRENKVSIALSRTALNFEIKLPDGETRVPTVLVSGDPMRSGTLTSPGEKTIVIDDDRFEPIELTRNVYAGTEATVRLVLSKKRVAVDLKTDPPGAEIHVNGDRRGTTPQRIAGRVSGDEMKVEFPGGKSESFVVDLSAAKDGVISKTFDLRPPEPLQALSRKSAPERSEEREEHEQPERAPPEAVTVDTPDTPRTVIRRGQPILNPPGGGFEKIIEEGIVPGIVVDPANPLNHVARIVGPAEQQSVTLPASANALANRIRVAVRVLFPPSTPLETWENGKVPSGLRLRLGLCGEGAHWETKEVIVRASEAWQSIAQEFTVIPIPLTHVRAELSWIEGPVYLDDLEVTVLTVFAEDKSIVPPLREREHPAGPPHLGVGTAGYMQTRDGMALIWNNNYQTDDEATWSGDTDRDGYGTGAGTLTWYADGKPRWSYSGKMVRGKLEGRVVNLDADGNRASGAYKRGKKTGVWRYYGKNGDQWTKEFGGE